MRTRSLTALAAVAGSLLATPAHATLPGFCFLAPRVAAESGALVRGDASVVRGAGGAVVGRIPALGAVEAAFPTRAARDEGVRALRAAGVVAQPEHVYTATSTKPNDPMLKWQWGLAKVGAQKAWDRDIGTSSPVLVAVLDTGVDLKHPDLLGHVTAGKNVADNTDDPTDNHGHGTHVAGIIAASTNNKVGVAGMSWGAQVLAVKVLGADGAGSDCDIALGIVDAVQAGAKVLNLSLGADGAPCDQVTQAAIDYALRQGALPVIAAGNGAKKGNKSSSPANCDGAFPVGATDANDRVAAFSTHQPYVAISAPGVSVLSTYLDAKTGKHTYAFLSGTSMATPMVAGLAALLLSEHGTWTPQQVRDRIVATADDKGARGKDPYYGAGRINAARALS